LKTSTIKEKPHATSFHRRSTKPDVATNGHKTYALHPCPFHKTSMLHPLRHPHFIPSCGTLLPVMTGSGPGESIHSKHIQYMRMRAQVRTSRAIKGNASLITRPRGVAGARQLQNCNAFECGERVVPQRHCWQVAGRVEQNPAQQHVFRSQLVPSLEFGIGPPPHACQVGTARPDVASALLLLWEPRSVGGRSGPPRCAVPSALALVPAAPPPGHVHPGENFSRS
jgi:hypothetical protein